MMGLFSEGRFYREGEELPQPVIATQLLGDLGVENASRDEQRRAVALWLRIHEPDEFLHEELAEHDLLPERELRAAS